MEGYEPTIPGLYHVRQREAMESTRSARRGQGLWSYEHKRIEGGGQVLRRHGLLHPVLDGDYRRGRTYLAGGLDLIQTE